VVVASLNLFYRYVTVTHYVENLCQLLLILDTRFWIRDVLDCTMRTPLVIEHPVSSIEYLPGKCNQQAFFCISF
jgi:hypothetical protein